MKTIKRIAHNLMFLSLAIGLTNIVSSCGKEGCTDETASNFDKKAKEDDGSCEYADETVTGDITANTTWDANRIWVISGKVVVKEGATLTIEPGTIIKGESGVDANATALIIARGGKIMANGTADLPIIFTSVNDNIAQGQKVGTNLSKTDNQQWGGLIILGKAPISAENGDTEANIEGIPADAGYGKYGGSDPADNSGTLNYVSIRHGGISIGEGNEINGLTLGGVGTGTKISNIEIYATLDDGVEFFGGTVDADNVLVYYQGDDGIDIDMNYSGTVSNFAVIHGDGIGTDEGLEIDGPEGSTYTDGLFTLTNGLCRIEGSEGSAGDFKSKAQGNVTNVTFEYGTKSVKFRASFDKDKDCAAKSDAAKYVSDGRLNFTNCKFAGVEVYENAEEPTCVDQTAAAQTAVAEKLVSGTGGSVDLSNFSWGAAGTNGEI